MITRTLAVAGLISLMTPYAGNATTPASPQVFITQTAVARGSVPMGAQRVPMLEIELQGGCSAPVVIESMTVHDSGLGRASDIERVYIMSGPRRISRGIRLSSQDKSAVIRLQRGFTLSACETQTVTVYADFSTTAAAGSEHSFMLKDESSVGTQAAVMVEQTDNTPAERSVRTTPSAIGTITVTPLELRSPVRYGTGRTVARFQLSADTRSEHLVSSILLTNDGSAKDADLQDLELVLSNGTTVSETSQLDGDTVLFRIDPPLLLTKGQTRMLSVRASVRASRSRTIRLEVDEPSDIQSSARIQRGASYQ